MLRRALLPGLALAVALGSLGGVARTAEAGVGDILSPDPGSVPAGFAVQAMEPAAVAEDPQRRPVEPYGQLWIGHPAPVWQAMPRARLYAARLAELHYPRLGVRWMSSPRLHHPQLEIGMGGQWAFWRWHPDGTDDWGFEIGGYGAMFMRFDLENDTDLLGTDGIWGFPLSFRWRTWSVKLHVGHLSGHLGDETIEHAGKTRINYLKEEFGAAVSWEPWRWVRWYAEGDVALRLGIEQGPRRQKAGRARTGVEFRLYEAWPDAWPVYMAWDFETRQEVGWNITTHLETGWVFWSDGYDRSWRLGVEWYVGRGAMTQFHDKRTQWWAICITADW